MMLAGLPPTQVLMFANCLKMHFLQRQITVLSIIYNLEALLFYRLSDKK